MGSSASKGARAAAGASTRKYPTRSPNATTTRAAAAAAPPPPPPTAAPSPPQPMNPGLGHSVHPQAQASEVKSEAIDLDARDPVLASRLNSLGAVQPNPHYSPTSRSSFDPQRYTSSDFSSGMMSAPPQSAFPDPRDNPALRLLSHRQRIQEEADKDHEMAGRKGYHGRSFVDPGLLTLILMRRKRGESLEMIEKAYDIKKGRLSGLSSSIVDAV